MHRIKLNVILPPDEPEQFNFVLVLKPQNVYGCRAGLLDFRVVKCWAQKLRICYMSTHWELNFTQGKNLGEHILRSGVLGPKLLRIDGVLTQLPLL
jgi:hypothetical protein